jgi:heme-degrading monooxygenase HmoA
MNPAGLSSGKVKGGTRMSTIARNRSVTVISTFAVNPGDQDRLLECLVDATHSVISKQPGFISAGFHKSLDGTMVVNDSRWESREDFYAYLEKPLAWATLREALKLGHAEYNVYELHAELHVAGPVSLAPAADVPVNIDKLS